MEGGAGMWNEIPRNDSRNSGIPGMVFFSLEFSNPNPNTSLVAFKQVFRCVSDLVYNVCLPRRNE